MRCSRNWDRWTESKLAHLSSCSFGMGDLDCVYHIALPELLAACEADEEMDVINDMVVGRRLRDIADLPLDLAV